MQLNKNVQTRYIQKKVKNSEIDIGEKNVGEESGVRTRMGCIILRDGRLSCVTSILIDNDKSDTDYTG